MSTNHPYRSMLPEVAGRKMLVSHQTFEERCKMLLAIEQEKPLPDNALIAVLCDAVRLSRECCDTVSSKVKFKNPTS